MNNLNFKKRIFFGVASTSLSQLISILQTILTVPLFINAWGVDGYGKWIILTSVIMYLNLLDFGGQNYIGNLLTNDYNNKDFEKFKINLSQGISIFIFIILIAILILSFFSFLILNPHISNVQNKFSLTELTIFFFIGVAFLISIPGGVYITIYRASGKFARATLIGNILKIAVLISTIILLYLRISMLYYSLYFLFTGIIGTFVIIFDSKKSFPLLSNVNINFTNAKRGIKYLKGSFSFWLIAISNSLNIQGIILVLSIYVDPSTIVLYSTHKMIGNFVTYIGNVFQAPLWPELTKLYTLKNIVELKNLILNSIKIIMFLTIVFILLIWVFIPYLYPIWSGKKVLINFNVLFLILLQAFISSSWTTVGWVLYATNNTSKIAIYSILNGIFTILMSLILIPKYNLIGLCISTIIGDLLFGFLAYPYLVNKIFGLNPYKFYKIFLQYIILLIPLIFAMIHINNLYINILLISLWIIFFIKFTKIFNNLKYINIE